MTGNIKNERKYLIRGKIVHLSGSHCTFTQTCSNHDSDHVKNFITEENGGSWVLSLLITLNRNYDLYNMKNHGHWWHVDSCVNLAEKCCKSLFSDVK